MKSKKMIRVIETHTEGMPTRIVTAGFPKIPGATMAEKARFLMESAELGNLATMLLDEPRGHIGQFGAVLTEPTTPGAVAGVVFFAPRYYHGGCGHGTIGVSTMLVQTGVVSGPFPIEFKLDTPVGPVDVRANGKDGTLESISFRNVPGFLYASDIEFEVPGIGKVKADVAYGGNYYVYVWAEDLGVRVRVENLLELRRMGTTVLNAAREQIHIESPDPKIPGQFGAIMIRDEPLHPKANGKNIVMGSVGFDRSPCGTGTSGWVAALHGKGKIKVGDEFVNESVIGSLFRGKVVEETKVGSTTAIIPEITGTAYITAFHDFVLDPNDPFPNGFKSYQA